LSVGILISHICNYYTSKEHTSVKDLSKVTSQGISLNIISGLSLGLGTTALPLILIALTIFYSYLRCHFYGIALTSIGFLSIVPIQVQLSCFRSIIDTSTGISTLCSLVDSVEITHVLNKSAKQSRAITEGSSVVYSILTANSLYLAFAI
jgi:K(+)-stimulated pyrophosphate-energized sodium pump